MSQFVELAIYVGFVTTYYTMMFNAIKMRVGFECDGKKKDKKKKKKNSQSKSGRKQKRKENSRSRIGRKQKKYT